MPVPHSYYTYLMIYRGADGESPRAGAFYVPKYGDTLSRIAQRAYTGTILPGVQRINRSLWNIEAAESNAFHYRKNSTSCKSSIVDPRLALTTPGYQDGAWLALCPPYPLIWVPESDGQRPEDLAPAGKAPLPKMQMHLPSTGVRSNLPPDVRSDTPAGYRAVTDPGPGSNSPFYQGQAGPTTMELAPLAPAGFRPWLLALLAALGAGAYLWHRNRKKKKKG